MIAVWLRKKKHPREYLDVTGRPIMAQLTVFPPLKMQIGVQGLLWMVGSLHILNNRLGFLIRFGKIK